jgi:hypothetical protein
MTDDKAEKIIWQEIRKRGITFYDMIGLSNYGVEEDPDDKSITGSRNTRSNRFKETLGSERMKEILCQGEKNPYDDFPPLKISFQDLFRFWFNRCIDKEFFVDEVLEGIYDHFLEQMRPSEKRRETMDMSLDFTEVIQVKTTDINEERLKRIGNG